MTCQALVDKNQVRLGQGRHLAVVGESFCNDVINDASFNGFQFKYCTITFHNKRPVSLLSDVEYPYRGLVLTSQKLRNMMTLDQSLLFYSMRIMGHSIVKRLFSFMRKQEISWSAPNLFILLVSLVSKAYAIINLVYTDQWVYL